MQGNTPVGAGHRHASHNRAQAGDTSRQPCPARSGRLREPLLAMTDYARNHAGLPQARDALAGDLGPGRGRASSRGGDLAERGSVGGRGDTAGGAVAAYVASERYEFLWIEYSRHARELRRLHDRRTAADGRPISGSELVAECEQVISVQNQAWMAKWGEEENAAVVG